MRHFAPSSSKGGRNNQTVIRKLRGRLSWRPLSFQTKRCRLMAHRIISLRCGIWSLSGHSGLGQADRPARFMGSRPNSLRLHKAPESRIKYRPDLSRAPLGRLIGRNLQKGRIMTTNVATTIPVARQPLVVDCSESCLTTAPALAARGIKVVMRYYSRPGYPNTISLRSRSEGNPRR